MKLQSLRVSLNEAEEMAFHQVDLISSFPYLINNYPCTMKKST